MGYKLFASRSRWLTTRGRVFSKIWPATPQTCSPGARATTICIGERGGYYGGGDTGGGVGGRPVQQEEGTGVVAARTEGINEGADVAEDVKLEMKKRRHSPRGGNPSEQ